MAIVTVPANKRLLPTARSAAAEAGVGQTP